MQEEYLDEYFVIEEEGEEPAGEPYISVETISVGALMQQGTVEINNNYVRPTGKKRKTVTFTDQSDSQEYNDSDEFPPASKKKRGPAGSSSKKKAPKQLSMLKIGDEVTLYAYKDCLGEYNSLIDNQLMPLWLRDGEFLMQKLLRFSYDTENGLIYQGSRVYGCWSQREIDNYLEIKAIVTEINQSGNSTDHISKYKILNLEMIEQQCIVGDFKSLNLEPYVPGGYGGFSNATQTTDNAVDGENHEQEEDDEQGENLGQTYIEV